MWDKVNEYLHTYITDHNFYQIEIGLDQVLPKVVENKITR